MTALWAIVECDHQRIRDLLDRLAGPAAGCSGSERRAAVEELAAVSSGHNAAEELVIWPAVRKLCPCGGELAAEALRQEGRLKRALIQLSSLPLDHQEFGACAYAVAVLARKHFAFEQEQVWPCLGGQLDIAGAAGLTMQWLSARTLTARRYRPVPRPPVPVSLGCLSPLARRPRPYYSSQAEEVPSVSVSGQETAVLCPGLGALQPNSAMEVPHVKADDSDVDPHGDLAGLALH